LNAYANVSGHILKATDPKGLCESLGYSGPCPPSTPIPKDVPGQATYKLEDSIRVHLPNARLARESEKEVAAVLSGGATLAAAGLGATPPGAVVVRIIAYSSE
jgi:hypothetical protein